MAERTQYYSADGRLITESLQDYSKALIHEKYQSLESFLHRWSEADRKQAVLEELSQQGLLIDALSEQVGRDLDAFDQPPLTRRERANNVRKRSVYARFQGKARAVIDALLEKYASEGVLPEDTAILRVQPLSGLGTPGELIKVFGGREGYMAAMRSLETELYQQEKIAQ